MPSKGRGPSRCPWSPCAYACLLQSFLCLFSFVCFDVFSSL